MTWRYITLTTVTVATTSQIGTPKHFHVPRLHDRGIDIDLLERALAVHVGSDHPAAGTAGHGLPREFILHFLQLARHLLGLLQHLEKVGH
jgi:hypothetical protein